jgi:endonuclease YncB( thermonuclease family)
MPYQRGLWRAVLVIGVFVVAAIAAALLEPLPPTLSGRASVADGDTLRLGADRIRLVGLDAPELDQTCLDASGTTWPCGRASSDRLRELIDDEELTCDTEGRDRYGRYLGRCTVGGTDLGAVLVAEGLAVSDHPSYAREEVIAREGQLGIWQGRFERPRQWRDTHGDAGSGFDLLGWIRSWFG